MQNMAVTVAIVGAARSAWFGRIALLLWLSLMLMDGNVRPVRSQFIFREDPLGRKTIITSRLKIVFVFVLLCVCVFESE